MSLPILKIAIAALTVITALFYLFVKSKIKYWDKKNVVSAKPVFFFGNLKEAALRRDHPNLIFQDLYDAFPKEKVVGIYRMWSPALLIRDPEILKYIMIKDFDKFVNRGTELSQKGLSSNLFHLVGNNWKVLRTKLTPVFTSGKLKNMMPLVNRHADNFMNYIEPEIKSHPEQDVYSLVQKFTIGTIAATAFGMDIELHQLEVKNNIFEKLDKLIFSANYVNEFDIMFPGALKMLNLSIFPRFITKFFYGMVDKIMRDRKGMSSSRKDFMDILLDIKNAGEVYGKKDDDDKAHSMKITEEIMAAQAFIFYAAGYETTATTISFLLRLLAINQDVQEKIIEEIDRVTKKHNGETTYDCIQDMTYLGQAIDETLRMFPIIDLQRSLGAPEYSIPGTDLTIEHGMMLMVSVRGIHYDEQYYPEPYKFDPERFSPENVSQRHPCVYMPFGIGTRNCIGLRFAKLEARLAVVKILQKYRLEPSGSTKLQLDRRDYDAYRATLALNGPNLLNVIPRTEKL